MTFVWLSKLRKLYTPAVDDCDEAEGVGRTYEI